MKYLLLMAGVLAVLSPLLTNAAEINCKPVQCVQVRKDGSVRTGKVVNGMCKVADLPKKTKIVNKD